MAPRLAPKTMASKLVRMLRLQHPDYHYLKKVFQYGPPGANAGKFTVSALTGCRPPLRVAWPSLTAWVYVLTLFPSALQRRLPHEVGAIGNHMGKG